MPIKALSDLDVEGRRVFLRVNLDVPLTPARGVADPTRLRDALPTMKHLLDRGVRLVLASPLGAPKGRSTPELSLLPVGAFLAEALGREVLLADEPAGDGARKVVADLREGQIALLENLRFSPGEEANEESFARLLASYGDVYVNDAFASLHRAHASVVAVAKHFGQRATGLQVARELDVLGPLRGDVPRPFVAILGGARVSDKLPLMQALVGRVDALCLGGALANTVLRARGGAMGRSLVEEDKLAVVRDILFRAQQRDVAIWLPRDAVAGAGTRAETGRVVSATHLPEDQASLDIGPETARSFGDVVMRSKTIVWSGPMGVYESEPFAAGTNAVAKALATVTGRGATTVLIGDHTGAAAHRAGVADRVTLVSTGGDAALEYLEGRKLPGLVALETAA
jgi:phosphoglycerate kinase